MKYRFEITYVNAGHRSDPEVDESGTALKKTVEIEVHESVPIEDARQQVAFELEEQHFRILTIEGSAVE